MLVLFFLFLKKTVGKKRRLGARPYKTFNEDTLQKAVILVKSRQPSEQKTAQHTCWNFKIDYTSLRHDQNLLPVGRQCVMSYEQQRRKVVKRTCTKIFP